MPVQTRVLADHPIDRERSFEAPPRVRAEGRATAETLAKNGCPVRTMHLSRLNEESLGALLMHFMLETIIAAHLLGVDAFDQPAVEEGKVLAKKYLLQ